MGKLLAVSFDRLVKYSGLNPINSCKVRGQNDAMPAGHDNALSRGAASLVGIPNLFPVGSNGGIGLATIHRIDSFV
jgi:hypothetical protein